MNDITKGEQAALDGYLDTYDDEGVGTGDPIVKTFIAGYRAGAKAGPGGDAVFNAGAEWQKKEDARILKGRCTTDCAEFIAAQTGGPGGGPPVAAKPA